MQSVQPVLQLNAIAHRKAHRLKLECQKPHGLTVEGHQQITVNVD
jgi:hypothetical protein